MAPTFTVASLSCRSGRVLAHPWHASTVRYRDQPTIEVTVGHLAALQQALHGADVDETGSAATAKDRDELLVADLGVQFGG